MVFAEKLQGIYIALRHVHVFTDNQATLCQIAAPRPCSGACFPKLPASWKTSGIAGDLRRSLFIVSCRGTMQNLIRRSSYSNMRLLAGTFPYHLPTTVCGQSARKNQTMTLDWEFAAWYLGYWENSESSICMRSVKQRAERVIHHILLRTGICQNDHARRWSACNKGFKC